MALQDRRDKDEALERVQFGHSVNFAFSLFRVPCTPEIAFLAVSPGRGRNNPDCVFDHPAPYPGSSPFLEDGLFFESFFYRQDKALLRFLVICRQ